MENDRSRKIDTVKHSNKIVNSSSHQYYRAIRTTHHRLQVEGLKELAESRQQCLPNPT